MKLTTEDHFVKHIKITTIYNELQSIQIVNYLQKILKVGTFISLACGKEKILKVIKLNNI